ncbi:hypothetical protein OF83DRAFT_1129121, partial [Amylostereum chailletii]
MPATVLVSFSLLALVVTARPIIPRDTYSQYTATPDVQHAVQAFFESRPKDASPDQLEIPYGDFDIRLTSAEEQQAFLSQLDSSAVKALVPLGQSELLSEDEKKLYEMLGGSDRMEDVEGEGRPVDIVSEGELSPEKEGELSLADEAESDPDAQSSEALTTVAPRTHTEPLILIAVSCILALLSVTCVGAFLYAVYYVRTYVLGSREAWDILPHLEKQQLKRGQADPELWDEKQRILGLGLRHMISRERLEKDDVCEKIPGALIDLESDTEDEYEDALSNSTTPTATPRMRSTGLPSTVNPLLVPLPASPRRGPAPLAEVSETTPRASLAVLPDDAPLPRPTSALDFAFAMQLRPGLGIGADPAWLVRF